ncbi:MAG TPA: DUF1735 domain-containing protein [Puia sp.]|jgi:hypothetical protein|nr:DUF1735 domain-containing protein [Puia sp.]
MKKMKMINKIKTISCSIGLLVVFVSLPSCLKNGAYYVDFSSVGASVDLPLAASTSNGITAFAYPPTVTSVTLPIAINVASPSLPTKATNVTIALDTAGLSAYNTANGTNYLPLPDSVFTISSMTVTIPAGKRLDTTITATINLAALDLSNAYVLPITIASASLPIEQWNHLFYYIAVKNQWDGKYGYSGYTLRAGDPVRTGNFTGQSMTLLTSGSNSVTFATLAIWADLSGIGIGNPTLTIDGSNNVTITSPGGATNQSGYSSRYDPSSKTFYISFYWGAGPTSRLSTDTLSYTGPR